jgi:hypothetical protein
MANRGGDLKPSGITHSLYDLVLPQLSQLAPAQASLAGAIETALLEVHICD